MRIPGIIVIASAACVAEAQNSADLAAVTNNPSNIQCYNFHLAITDVRQWHPSFPARYSGAQQPEQPEKREAPRSAPVP